jgi:hypothetical protein
VIIGQEENDIRLALRVNGQRLTHRGSDTHQHRSTI